MTIQSEIEAVRAASRKKIAALNERKAKAQIKLDLRVVALLRAQLPDAAAKLDALAREQLASEAAARSAKAAETKAANAAEVPETVAAPSSHDDGDTPRYEHDQRSGS